MRERKIRVLQVIGSLHIGGAENVAANLYRYIDRNKYEFHYVVYTEEEGEYEKEIVELGGKVIHIHGPAGDRYNFCKRIERIIEENGPYEIVHSHMMLHNGIILSIAKKKGVKIRISHSHSTKNTIRNNIAMKVMDIGYTLYQRYLIRKSATHWWACGEAAGAFLYGKEFFEKKGLVIHNGIDIEKYNPRNYYTEEEYKVLVSRLKAERKAWLAKYELAQSTRSESK